MSVLDLPKNEDVPERSCFEDLCELVEKSATRSPALNSLLEAKDASDQKNWTRKHLILRRLITEAPNDFVIDSSRSDGVVGLTHAPSNFRIHMPGYALPTPLAQVGQQEKAAQRILDLITKEAQGTVSAPVLAPVPAPTPAVAPSPAPALPTSVQVDSNGRTAGSSNVSRVFSSGAPEIDINGRPGLRPNRDGADAPSSSVWRNPTDLEAAGSRHELGTGAAYESRGPVIQRNLHRPEFARFVESVNPILANNPVAAINYRTNHANLYRGDGGGAADNAYRASPIMDSLLGRRYRRGSFPSSYGESVSTAGRDQYLRNMYRHVRPPDFYRTANSPDYAAFFHPATGRIAVTPSVSFPFRSPIDRAALPSSTLSHEVAHGTGSFRSGDRLMGEVPTTLSEMPTTLTDSVARDEIASNASRTALVPQLLGSLGMSATTGGLPAVLGTVAGQEQAVRYHAPTSYNPSGWRSYYERPGWEPTRMQRLFGRQPIPPERTLEGYLNQYDSQEQNIRRLAHESAQRRGYFHPRNEHETLNIYPTLNDVLPQMFRER